jgi:hypothetical protein
MIERDSLGFLKVGQPIHFHNHLYGEQDGVVHQVVDNWCVVVIDERGAERLVFPAEYIYSHPVQ